VGLPVSEARVPTIAVFVNAVQVPGILAADIDLNSHLAANRFRIRASLTASGATIWNQTPLLITIRFGLDGALSTLMTGNADRVTIDPIRGEVSIDGRDLSSRLIASRIQQAFENQTASEVATQLATDQGLQAAVITTTQPVGRYFQNGHTQTSLDQHARTTTAWDLLIRLAEFEGFEVWVEDETLYFMPASTDFGTLSISPSDCISMDIQQSMSLSNNLEVTVKSWNCIGQHMVQQNASAGGTVGTPSNYVIVRPNLTAAAAQMLAQSVVNQMAAQARSVSFEMPGDLTTMPRMMLTLSDTGTAFDGSYVISDVERRLSFSHGFTQYVQARSPYWTVSST
jgi:phage protein D